MSLASPLHLRQTWFGSATSRLVIPLQLLWTHRVQCEHWMELLATLLQQAAPGYYTKFLVDIMANTRDQELGLLHVDTELGYALLLGVCDEHQVISIEKLPWPTRAELTRKLLQHPSEEQWPNDRAMMHAKLLDVLTIDSHTTLHNTCPGWHAQPIPRPWGSLRPTIEPFLAHDWRLFPSQRRQSTAIFSSDVLLLQLGNNEDGVVPLPGTKLNCISSIFTISWMCESSIRSSSFMIWSVSLSPQ